MRPATRLPAVENPEPQRLATKVARLYHTHGLRQTEIADRLAISQSRVSRLLTQAEDAGIVRTVVAVPLHVHADPTSDRPRFSTTQPAARRSLPRSWAPSRCF